jgi:hypothetical protein
LFLEGASASILCDVYNEDHVDAFRGFALRCMEDISALIEKSPIGCIFKPISDSMRFKEILESFPEGRAVFVIRNPLDIILSFKLEFKSALPNLAHDIVYHYKWSRLSDLNITFSSWDPVDCYIEKYSSRFNSTGDYASLIALNWLLMHTLLICRGICTNRSCAIVLYDDIFHNKDAVDRNVTKLLGSDVNISFPKYSSRERRFYKEDIDVELAKDCMETYAYLKRASHGKSSGIPSYS